MSPDERIRILSRLQTEFPTTGERLAALEHDLTAGVITARNFGSRQGTSLAWDALWTQHWDDVAHYLQRIHFLLGEMEQYTRTSSADLLQAAMEAWEEMQAELVQLAVSLKAIQSQAVTLNPAVRTEWNSVVQNVEPHLATLHTFSTVQRIRIELLRANSREGLDSIVAHLLSSLPGHRAALLPDPENQQEPNPQTTEPSVDPLPPRDGFMDVLKVLLMWVDKPVHPIDGTPVKMRTAARPSVIKRSTNVLEVIAP